MSDKTPQHDSGKSAQRPGPLLKEARERMDLSRKDIASQLNLQVEMIEAIEEDRIDQFPAATYARGYIRSYARIVKQDADEMIRLFDNEPIAPPEFIPDIKSTGQASSQDKPVRAVTYLVTFGLVLLLIAWLQSNYVVEKNKAVDQADTSGTSEEPETYQELPPWNNSTPGDQPERTGAAAANTAGDNRLSDLRINKQAEASEVDEQILNSMALTGTDGFEDEEPVTATGDSVAGENQTDESVETISEDRLVLKINGESWIEVYDSGDNRLYLGLAKAGEEIRLTGIAPFSVLLGYSPAVEVTYNGHPYDTKPHSNAGVARFTLGEDSHNN
ncbi:MAG TPA: RodZ domain-containing protein [Gammaproteobacteria bacterium]|nr:RodZ domain-containing protein [Gammaproteobacteria bacterium]